MGATLNWRSWRNRYHFSPFADTQGHRSVLQMAKRSRTGSITALGQHYTPTTSVRIESLRCEQSRKAPRTREGSDFGWLLWSQRFGSLAHTLV